MKKIILVTCSALAVSLPAATAVMARNTILTGGLSVSYDYQDRTYDNDTTATLVDNDRDYSQLIFAPLLQLVSSSPIDRYELLIEPGINHDLDDSDTEIDENYLVSVERYLSRVWKINGSNRFFRSDYDDTEGDLEATAPDLSADLGRSRYYRNNLNLSTEYQYGVDSLVNLGAGWVLLRDDGDGNRFDEYDKYSVSLRSEHRYTVRWKTITELMTVRGDFKENDPAELSEDLYEYYFDLGLENNSFSHDPLTLTYSYAGTRFDEEAQSDNDIHELNFSWRHDFNPQFFTVVGAGPTYEKTEGHDENWGTNAIVQADYQVQKGFYRFLAEKGFRPNNFAGNAEIGAVDFWRAEFAFLRQLGRYLAMDGRLVYHTEERTDPRVAAGPNEIEEDRYTAGLGLAYTFWRYYTARVDYIYYNQDSDQPEDNYDDHRVVVSLSWLKDLYRW